MENNSGAFDHEEHFYEVEMDKLLRWFEKNKDLLGDSVGCKTNNEQHMERVNDERT